jgi:uncharacterized membrane protein
MTSLYFWLGIFIAGLGVPLALGRVPRNRWYGYRTRRTLADDGTWYLVNRVSGKSLVVAGLVTAFMALVWARVLPAPAAQSLANTITLIVTLGASVAWTEVTTRS